MTKQIVGRPSTWLGVVSALGLTACNNDPDVCAGQTFEAPPEPSSSSTAPPTVLSGEWIGAGVLELQFSKPFSPDASVDPRRFALVNWSVTAQEYYGTDSCNVSTTYREFGVTYSYYYQQAQTISDVWVAPENPSILRLRAGSLGSTCTAFGGLLEDGLILAYTGGSSEGVGRLLDAEGDPVPSLGPLWALPQWSDCVLDDLEGLADPYSSCRFQLSSSYQGSLPFNDTLAPIPCP